MNAFKAGNLEGVKAAFILPQGDAGAKMVELFKRDIRPVWLYQVAVEKFGPAEGARYFPDPSANFDGATQGFLQAPIMVDGNIATLTVPAPADTGGIKAPPMTIKFQRVGSDWKITDHFVYQADPVPPEYRPMVEAQQKLLEQALADINAGKFKTAAEAAKDLGEKWVLTGKLAPASQPAK
jgi:hypothetical protein